MDTEIIAALISGVAAVIAAFLKIIPALRNKKLSPARKPVMTTLLPRTPQKALPAPGLATSPSLRLSWSPPEASEDRGVMLMSQCPLCKREPNIRGAFCNQGHELCFAGELEGFFVKEFLKEQGGMGHAFCLEDDSGRRRFLKTVHPKYFDVYPDETDLPTGTTIEEWQQLLQKYYAREYRNGRQANEAGVAGVPLYFPIDFLPVTLGDGGGGLPCICTEWLEGIDLQRWMTQRRHALSPDFFLEKTLGFCQIIQQLHYIEIKPLRDITPDNLMLEGEEEHPTVIDLGIALNDGTGKTTALMGKPNYASPEQRTGEPLDERSDIFSLAIVLYEWITSHNLGALLPGQIDPSHTLSWQAMLERLPPLPRSYPEGLLPLLQKMMAFDPARRPFSIGDVMDHLLRAWNRPTAWQQLTLHKTEEQNFSAQLAGKESEQQSLATQLAEKESEQQSLATQLAEKESEQQSLTAQLAEKEAEKQSLAVQLTTAQESQWELQREFQQTKEKHEELARRHSASLHEGQQLRDECRRLESELQETSDRCRGLERELQQTQQSATELQERFDPLPGYHLPSLEEPLEAQAKEPEEETVHRKLFWVEDEEDYFLRSKEEEASEVPQMDWDAWQKQKHPLPAPPPLEDDDLPDLPDLEESEMARLFRRPLWLSLPFFMLEGGVAGGFLGYGVSFFHPKSQPWHLSLLLSTFFGLGLGVLHLSWRLTGLPRYRERQKEIVALAVMGAVMGAVIGVVTGGVGGALGGAFGGTAFVGVVGGVFGGMFSGAAIFAVMGAVFGAERKELLFGAVCCAVIGGIIGGVGGAFGGVFVGALGGIVVGVVIGVVIGVGIETGEYLAKNGVSRKDADGVFFAIISVVTGVVGGAVAAGVIGVGIGVGIGGAVAGVLIGIPLLSKRR